jgi:hypothetical protein
MNGFNALDLESVRSWREGFTPPMDFLATVSHLVGFDYLMVAMQLIWPMFHEERGCVVLPSSYDSTSLENWWNHLEGDRAQVEQVLNHLHLWDLFSTDEVTESGFRHLGRTLALTWAAALAHQFPAREFNVVFSEDPDDYGPTVYIDTMD